MAVEIESDEPVLFSRGLTDVCCGPHGASALRLGIMSEEWLRILHYPQASAASTATELMQKLKVPDLKFEFYKD